MGEGEDPSPSGVWSLLIFIILGPYFCGLLGEEITRVIRKMRTESKRTTFLSGGALKGPWAGFLRFGKRKNGAVKK